MPAEKRLQFDDALFEQTTETIEVAKKNSESHDSAALSASSSMSESVYSQLTSSSSSLIDGGTSTDQSVDHIDTIYRGVDAMMPPHYHQHHTTNYGQLIRTPKMPNQRDDLSQFKVLRTFGSVMQVQDTNTKHVYIMKSFYKSADVDDDTYLPANFPFMVSLVAYYLSDSNVYLLLEQASGGKLFDYIRSYDRKSAEKGQQCLSDFLLTSNVLVSMPKYETNPIKIPQSVTAAPTPQPAKLSTNENCIRTAATALADGDSFYHLLQSYYNKSAASDDTTDYSNSCETIIANSRNDEAPHFDLIANDLDVNNLLQCSKKLLNSVSHTLHKIQNHRFDENVAMQENDSLFGDSGESADEDVDDRVDANGIHSNVMSNVTADCFPTNKYSSDDDDNYRVAVRLPKAILRRWFREIIFAIKHLHANHIFCYDLQPDNLLLGKNGEILLTYFYRREFTAYFDVKSLNKSCYASAHIAPERPLTALSDIWSIGVIFFELVTGTSFQSCHPNGILSYYDIQYPEDFDIDENTKDLLEGLLQVNPEHRFRLDEIEAHPFFNSI